jgi:hypothetical protein
MQWDVIVLWTPMDPHKNKWSQVLVADAYNPSYWEAEIRRTMVLSHVSTGCLPLRLGLCHWMPIWKFMAKLRPTFSSSCSQVSVLTKVSGPFWVLSAQGERWGPACSPSVDVEFCQHHVWRAIFLPKYVFGSSVKNLVAVASWTSFWVFSSLSQVAQVWEKGSSGLHVSTAFSVWELSTWLTRGTARAEVRVRHQFFIWWQKAYCHC